MINVYWPVKKNDYVSSQSNFKTKESRLIDQKRACDEYP